MGLASTSGVVTGGAAGIGAAIARHLTAAGATVAVWDLDEEGARAPAGDEQSALLTGATLRVDGGWTAQGWIS
jgi:NAD(P)-dependent dehydrogenase (short-subunit alcohol dehydrogenase family)